MPPLLDSVNEISLTPIQKFYSGASVFVTGGTGFLGQLVIEKLLRACPDIGNIYVLIRGKKSKNMTTRLDQLLDGEIFDRLKETYPKYKYKVVGIEGDCSLPNLGINQQDQKLLTTEVSVVFHIAATVNFDEKLATAIDINIKGTKSLLDLCRQMSCLKAIVHVSTAFSNCAEDVIEEIFYPTPVQPKQLLAIRDTLDEKVLQTITPTFLDQLPNTYAFTKAIAEKMIQEEGNDLPIAVYRPSIVLSTYKEPLEGWVNNLYGAVGVAAGAATGVLRILHCDAEVNANLVPADMAVNALLAIPWEVDSKYLEARRYNRHFDIPIYNYESSTDQPLKWRDYMELTTKYGISLPTINTVWYYSLHLIKHYRLYQLLAFFIHYIPAFLVDAVLFITGKKTRFVRLYHKIHHFNEVISYFNTKEFKFRSLNVRNLISSMSPKDQDIFFCNLRKLDWDDYFKTHFKGMRVYLLKDPLTTLPQARKRFRRLYIAHQALKVIFGYVLLRLTWMLCSYIFNKII